MRCERPKARRSGSTDSGVANPHHMWFSHAISSAGRLVPRSRRRAKVILAGMAARQLTVPGPIPWNWSSSQAPCCRPVLVDVRSVRRSLVRHRWRLDLTGLYDRLRLVLTPGAVGEATLDEVHQGVREALSLSQADLGPS